MPYKPMKRFPKSLQGSLILLVFFFLIVALSAHRFSPIPHTDASFGAAAFFAQPTPTTEVEGNSEIGSTDGIVLMGVVIVMIVVVPILLRRNKWSDN
ncbi:MAG: hypothetical protein AB1649_13735 [Chloroflexota bacterium]